MQTVKTNYHSIHTSYFQSKPLIKSVLKEWLLVLVLFIGSLASFAQKNIGRQTILQFDSNSSVLKPDAPLLMESVPMETGRNNALFLGGVGGVSFDQVAKDKKITN